MHACILSLYLFLQELSHYTYIRIYMEWELGQFYMHISTVLELNQHWLSVALTAPILEPVTQEMLESNVKEFL